MKVKPLPKSGMPKIVDKVVNVPIYNTDIENTIASLPRMPNESAIVEVELKRKAEMKNTHAHEYIRPLKTTNAVNKLQELGNPHYQDVTINENFEEAVNATKGNYIKLYIFQLILKCVY